MFCLSDISITEAGTYRLKFCLFKLNTMTGEVENLTPVCFEPFMTYSGKRFPGMSESRLMTRLLIDAGMHLHLRKKWKTKERIIPLTCNCVLF
ncbi:velvet factor [Diaporthe sp. PMI_573]|nr:velvet factor [Diaporthaceae sp. PMI_573]